jgi:hypothetical protein
MNVESILQFIPNVLDLVPYRRGTRSSSYFGKNCAKNVIGTQILQWWKSA